MKMILEKKRITKILIPLVLSLISITNNGIAADKDEMMERFGRLEIGQEMLNKRIDDVRSEIKYVRSEIKDVRTEIKDVRTEIKDVRTEIKDVRFEINDMRSEIVGFMFWGITVIFAGIFTLIGFVLWDRRTALAPAIRKNRELEEREERVERALKEMAEKEEYVKSALKHAGIL